MALTVDVDGLDAAATEVARVGSAISRAHAVAAPTTTSVVAAAADEVSAAIAGFFSERGQAFQVVSARAAAFHREFALALGTGGAAYAAAEAANSRPLKTLIADAQQYPWFSPWQVLTGRPLFGVGADGASGTGQAGAAGGCQFGGRLEIREVCGRSGSARVPGPGWFGGCHCRVRSRAT